jgi:hypothetical protein
MIAILLSMIWIQDLINTKHECYLATTFDVKNVKSGSVMWLAVCEVYVHCVILQSETRKLVRSVCRITKDWRELTTKTDMLANVCFLLTLLECNQACFIFICLHAVSNTNFTYLMFWKHLWCPPCEIIPHSVSLLLFCNVRRILTQCSLSLSLSIYIYIYIPPLWSSGQSSWLQIQGSRVRFPGTTKKN